MIVSSIDTSRVAPVVPEGTGRGLTGATTSSNAGLLELLAEQTEDLLWVKDLTSGRTLYVNDAYERVWGRSRKAIYDDPMDWRRDVDPEDCTVVQEAFDALFRHGVPLEICYRIRVGASVRWARERAWTVQDARWPVPLAVGIVCDITERKELESQQKLLLREMNHRLKNTLATVLSISNQTVASSSTLAEYDASFTGRVQAFARAHELLIQNDWDSVLLEDVVSKTLSPYLGGTSKRVILNGPPVFIPHGPAVALNMVFHELGTNAAKYGVLSSPAGQLLVSWSVEKSGAEQFVNFRWEETGGPPVTPPARRGFGSRLVKRTLASLGGSAEMNFSASGLDCWIVLPVPVSATAAEIK
jgi:PAS domain S-box-containing protein